MGVQVLYTVCVAGIAFLLWFLVHLCRDKKGVAAHRAAPVASQKAKQDSSGETQWITPFPGATYDYRNRHTPAAAVRSR